MNYAPMSDPEDYGMAQSQEMGDMAASLGAGLASSRVSMDAVNAAAAVVTVVEIAVESVAQACATAATERLYLEEEHLDLDMQLPGFDAPSPLLHKRTNPWMRSTQRLRGARDSVAQDN
ncbi:hypothetical protein OPT61_g1109 [Boeremia exigua]|uniref:Uncharacterized protein n=1 Tax=Boeremia exigua TaxID=749465 RepID=A0ACC2IRF8_9PLEO|nr:hypothetical protein OPT61_g1109 [Boeremia exigua]